MRVLLVSPSSSSLSVITAPYPGKKAISEPEERKESGKDAHFLLTGKVANRNLSVRRKDVVLDCDIRRTHSRTILPQAMFVSFSGGKTLIIRFKNWESYNPASAKTNSWFRLNSNLPSRPIWDELDHECFRIFVYLLCQANESAERGTTMLSTVNVSRRCAVSEKTVTRAIEILKYFQVIEIRTRSGHFTHSEQTLPTYERNDTNERTNNNNLSDSTCVEVRRVFDFNALYKEYPRKEGKTKGLLACKAQIKTEDDYLLLKQAIYRYRAHVQKTATDSKYIKLFSTFMSSWRDWLDPETGTASVAPQEINWDSVFGGNKNGP